MYHLKWSCCDEHRNDVHAFIIHEQNGTEQKISIYIFGARALTHTRSIAHALSVTISDDISSRNFSVLYHRCFEADLKSQAINRISIIIVLYGKTHTLIVNAIQFASFHLVKKRNLSNNSVQEEKKLIERRQASTTITQQSHIRCGISFNRFVITGYTHTQQKKEKKKSERFLSRKSDADMSLAQTDQCTMKCHIFPMVSSNICVFCYGPNWMVCISVFCSSRFLLIGPKEWPILSRKQESTSWYHDKFSLATHMFGRCR